MARRRPIRTTGLARRLGAGVLLAVALAACTTGLLPGTGGCGGRGQAGPSPACSYPPTAPPGVADEATAVARARAAVGDEGSAATIVWAVVEPAGSDVPPGHDWLWTVRLAGAGLRQDPCPSGYLDGPVDLVAAPCLDGDGGLNVVMDAFSIEVIGTRH